MRAGLAHGMVRDSTSAAVVRAVLIQRRVDFMVSPVKCGLLPSFIPDNPHLRQQFVAGVENFLQADHRDQAAIVGIFRMDAATIRVEPIRRAIGALAAPFRMAHIGAAQPP